MKKFVTFGLIAVLLYSCSKKEREPERNFQYIGTPIQGPLAKDGNYNEAGYIIQWPKKDMKIIAIPYSSNPNDFRYIKIENNKITAKSPITIQQDSDEGRLLNLPPGEHILTFTYQITLEKDGKIIASQVGNDGTVYSMSLLLLDLKNGLGASYSLATYECIVNPFSLIDVSIEMN